jgi:hypothetical protein
MWQWKLLISQKLGSKEDPGKGRGQDTSFKSKPLLTYFL